MRDEKEVEHIRRILLEGEQSGLSHSSVDEIWEQALARQRHKAQVNERDLSR